MSGPARRRVTSIDTPSPIVEQRSPDTAAVYSPCSPGRTNEHHNSFWDTVRLIFGIALGAFFIHGAVFDWWKTGFGTSNMRVVSFVDSLWHCYNFRMRAVPYYTDEAVTSPDKPPRRKRRNSIFVYTSRRKSMLSAFQVLARALFIKYLGGTVISLAFGAKPVWAQGFRHILFFLIALTAVQGLPLFLPLPLRRHIHEFSYRGAGFFVYTIKRFPLLRKVMQVSGALYKMRKVTFITATCIAGDYPAAVLVLLSIVACECSSITMSVDAKVAGHHSVVSAVASSLVGSRWRVTSFSAACLIAECVIYGPNHFLATASGHAVNGGWDGTFQWQWCSPLRWLAFALLVVRNTGGFRSVEGYPILGAVANVFFKAAPNTETDVGAVSKTPRQRRESAAERIRAVRLSPEAQPRTPRLAPIVLPGRRKSISTTPPLGNGTTDAVVGNRKTAQPEHAEEAKGNADLKVKKD